MSDNTTVRGWLRRRYEARRRRTAHLAPEVQTNLWDRTRMLNTQQFAVLNTAPVSMLPAERLLLYTLVFGVRPRRYLEVGTLFGGSAAIVCAALDTLDWTRVLISVDPEPRIAPALWGHLQRRATLVQGYSRRY